MSSERVPDLTSVYASVAGGVLWSLARLYVAAFNPTPPRKRDIAAAVVESTCALITAAIGGYYVSPVVCRSLHVERTDIAGLISVGIGLGFWQSIPVLRMIATAALVRLASLRLKAVES